MTKISKRTVDAAKPDPGGGRYILWDIEIKGFGLIVLPSGVKSYIFNYRTPEGRSRRATIGKHGDWTPDQARRRAAELRDAVRAGQRPSGGKVCCDAICADHQRCVRCLSPIRALPAESGQHALSRGRPDQTPPSTTAGQVVCQQTSVGRYPQGPCSDPGRQDGSDRQNRQARTGAGARRRDHGA